SCASTCNLQLIAFTLDILPHAHTFVVGGLVKGDAGLFFPRQQNAAAGVDDAAVALGQVLGDVGRFAALRAVPRDEGEGVFVGGADGGGFLGMGAADDQPDAGVAVLAHIVLAQGRQAVAHQVVDVAAVGQGLVLKVLGAGVGGAAQHKHALALL